MPELDALARTGFIFDANRATSGAAVRCARVASSRRSPRALMASSTTNRGSRRDVTTLADVARQAGIRAAMFTANPTTGSAFGFGRGWDTFVEHPPDLAEAPGAAVAPFEDAVRWIR